jgi:hypothetical protein
MKGRLVLVGDGNAYWVDDGELITCAVLANGDVEMSDGVPVLFDCIDSEDAKKLARVYVSLTVSTRAWLT